MPPGLEPPCHQGLHQTSSTITNNPEVPSPTLGPPPTQQPAPLSWKTEKELHTAPSLLVTASGPGSAPPTQPGSQNTHKRAAKPISQGKKYKRTDLVVGNAFGAPSSENLTVLQIAGDIITFPPGTECRTISCYLVS